MIHFQMYHGHLFLLFDIFTFNKSKMRNNGKREEKNLLRLSANLLLWITICF